MNRIVREVKGASSLEKNAAVLAFATAPSMANTRSASRPVYIASTSDSVRTPRIRPDRSTMAMIASLLEVAMEARLRRQVTSFSVMMGPEIKGSSIAADGSPTGIGIAKFALSSLTTAKTSRGETVPSASTSQNVTGLSAASSPSIPTLLLIRLITTNASSGEIRRSLSTSMGMLIL